MKRAIYNRITRELYRSLLVRSENVLTVCNVLDPYVVPIVISAVEDQGALNCVPS